MEELFVRPWARTRMHDGPLGVHIDAFIDTLVEKGYARDSRRRVAWLIGDFSRWLLQKDIAANDITHECADTFLRSRKRRRAPRYEDCPTLSRLLAHLAHSGVIEVTVDARTPTAAEQLEAEYVEYMRRERNLAPTTVHSNRLDARRLLESLFVDGTVTLANVTAQDVIAHIMRVTRTCRPTSACRVIGGVRAFFRFALYRGLVSSDLSVCIPTPAVWSQSSIPRALEDDHVRRTHCSMRSNNGQRMP